MSGPRLKYAPYVATPLVPLCAHNSEISSAAARDDQLFLQQTEELRRTTEEAKVGIPQGSKGGGLRAARMQKLWSAPVSAHEAALKALLGQSPKIKDHNFQIRVFGDSLMRGFACRRLKIRIVFTGKEIGQISVSPGRRTDFEKVTINVPSRRLISGEDGILESILSQVISEQIELREKFHG